MALNFPNSPVDGQIYYDPTSGAKYVWVAASSKWKSMQYSSTIVAFGYQTANAAYDTSNAAFDMANAAFSIQNVDFTLSNSAFIHANASYDSANSNWAVQNALYSVANSAFDAANNVGPQIAPTYNTANAAFAVANAALPNVSNAVFAGNLRVTGNLLIGMNTVTIKENHIISAEYYRMNTANHMVVIPDGNRVNTLFSLVNVSFDTANASYNSANNVGPQIAPTYNTANAAYNHANAAHTIANAAYAYANTKFSSSGGSISGAVEINADLTVRGNTRFIDQQTLAVGDPLIYLAANNYTSDIVDIGFVANYVNTTSVNVHTGLFRSSATKEYYLFQGYDKEPINNYIDPTGNNISMAVLNSSVRTSNLILGGANAINWITSAYGATNAAFGVANAAYGAANNVGPQIAPAYNTANAAFAKANNALPLAGGTLTGKPTISIDDASMAIAGSHLTLNSPTLSQISLGFAFGGTGKASLRIDNGGSFVMNGAANTYYYGYDIVSGGAATSNFYTGSAYFMSAAGSAVTFPGSARSPIFYDSDNTGYYVDPASTSNFYGGTFNTTLGISSGTSTGLNITTSSSGPWALQLIRSDVGSTVQVFNNNGHWYFGQYVVALGSMRSPLFYDSDNTGYYVNPNSSSLLNQLTTYAHFFGGEGGDSGQPNHSYAIYQAGGAWTSPYPDLRIAYHTGIQLGAQTGYGGIRFYSEETMVNEIMSIGNGDSHVRITNNLYANFPSLFQSTTNATTSGDRSLGYSTSWTNHLSVTFTTTKTGPVYAGMVLAMTYESAAVQGEAQFYLTGPSNFTSQYMAVAQQSDANRARGAHSMTWMFGNVPAGSYTLYLQVRNNGSGSTWILNNYLGFDTLYCSYM